MVEGISSEITSVSQRARFLDSWSIIGLDKIFNMGFSEVFNLGKPFGVLAAKTVKDTER